MFQPGLWDKIYIFTKFKDISANSPDFLSSHPSFSSTFPPLRPQHGQALLENKPLKLANIPAHRLAGAPQSGDLLSYPAERRKNKSPVKIPRAAAASLPDGY